MYYLFILLLLIFAPLYSMEESLSPSNDQSSWLEDDDHYISKVPSLKDIVLTFLACHLSEENALKTLTTASAFHQELPEELLINLREAIIKHRSNLAWKELEYSVESLFLPVIEYGKEHLADFLDEKAFVTHTYDSLKYYQINPDQSIELIKGYGVPYPLEILKIDNQTLTAQFLFKQSTGYSVGIWDLKCTQKSHQVDLTEPIYDFHLSPNKKYLFLISRSPEMARPQYQLYIYDFSQKQFIIFGHDNYYELGKGLPINHPKTLFLNVLNHQLIIRIPSNDGVNIISRWNLSWDNHTNPIVQLVSSTTIRSHKIKNASVRVTPTNSYCIFNRPVAYDSSLSRRELCFDIISLEQNKKIHTIRSIERHPYPVEIETTSDGNLFITPKDYLWCGFENSNYTDDFKSLYIIEAHTGKVIATPTTTDRKELNDFYFKEIKVCTDNSCLILFSPFEQGVAFVKLSKPYKLQSVGSQISNWCTNLFYLY